MNMNKVKSYTKTFYDFIEMKALVNEKLGYDQRNVGKYLFPNGADFEAWYAIRGKEQYGDKNFAKERYDSSEYERTPYLDFWHWQLDNCCSDSFANDSYSSFSINPELAEDEQEWIKNIQNMWYETFKDIADEDGNIDIWVCW